MSARSKARKRAFEILFEAEQRGVNAVTLLDERILDPRRAGQEDHPVAPFAADLVRGVVAHWATIDDALGTYSQGWALDRMPAVDRSILRIGAYEVLFSTEVPEGVAISEAVALARELSTDDSPTFVNGLLSRLQEVKPTLV
ncbi:transcription antitermination factor NusB [Arsenicicoccus piscis]|uniref:Transcription antitermination protein NusB n=1 Tax=Arsenicicoccus piscis TaxID=673954 RepID=A0ABQ6HNI0_9MICO|nr:transcription antitermination factor NusB [Arsenicicoccus piscis]MCH8626838.1 transcription antitermination factor NusB [Arsenicicoccus piscis]GMA19259.1 N utilization substance protein B [Arsenicicoccus piscis]